MEGHTEARWTGGAVGWWGSLGARGTAWCTLLVGQRGAGAVVIWGPLPWVLRLSPEEVQGPLRGHSAQLLRAFRTPIRDSRLPRLPFSYEDPAALDGGEKGMDIIEHVLALAPRLLKDSG